MGQHDVGLAVISYFELPDSRDASRDTNPSSLANLSSPLTRWPGVISYLIMAEPTAEEMIKAECVGAIGWWHNATREERRYVSP